MGTGELLGKPNKMLGLTWCWTSMPPRGNCDKLTQAVWVSLALNGFTFSPLFLSRQNFHYHFYIYSWLMVYCWSWNLSFFVVVCFSNQNFTLQPLYNRIKSSLGKETKPCLLLIDDITALLSIGIHVQEVISFIHYCSVMMCSSPTTVCVNVKHGKHGGLYSRSSGPRSSPLPGS